MIDLSILPFYLAAVIALLLIPGPDMLLVVSSSLSYGRRVGLFTCLGSCIAGFILSLLAAIGVSALVAMSPGALTVLKIVGAIYLFKMAWDCMCTDPCVKSELSVQKNMAAILFRRAIFSNLLNPKALIFFVLFLPQFVSPHISTSSGMQMMTLGFILNAVALFFNCIVAIMVGSLGKKLLDGGKFSYYQHKVMGSIFLVLAIWLLLIQIDAPALIH